jgi:hypothetical protein
MKEVTNWKTESNFIYTSALHTIMTTTAPVRDKYKPCIPSTFHLATLSLQDMVSRRSPCNIPSHVCVIPVGLTGIVPSPDSIFVLNWPRAFLFGWGSSSSVLASWGEKIWIYNYLYNPCLSPLKLWVRIPLMERCTKLSDKVCQWLTTYLVFSGSLWFYQ